MADHDQISASANAQGTVGSDSSNDAKAPADSSRLSDKTEHNGKSTSHEAHKPSESEAERASSVSVETETDAVKQETLTEQRDASEKHDSNREAEKPGETSNIVTLKTENVDKTSSKTTSSVGKNNKEVSQSTNDEEANRSEEAEGGTFETKTNVSCMTLQPEHNVIEIKRGDNENALSAPMAEIKKDFENTQATNQAQDLAQIPIQPETPPQPDTKPVNQPEPESQTQPEDVDKSTGKDASSTDTDATGTAKKTKEAIEQKVKLTKAELEQRVKLAKGELEQKVKQTKEELELKMKKSFKFIGIEFAPVLMPIERRLQTLAVLGYLSFVTTFPLLLLLLFIVSLFTSWFYLPLVYATWMLVDRHTPHRGGRRYDIMRRLPIWRYFRDYFPIQLTKTADLNPSRNYLIGFHPHGILAFGAMINFCTEATNFSKLFPGITPYVLTLNSNFRLPVMRAYFMSLGFCAVSRESIKHILTSGKGHAAVIVVGGAEEGLEARPGSYTIVLRYRKGFVRQAIRAGADLIPCYSFGENDMYKQMENNRGSKLRNFQEWFKRTMGFSPPIIYGRGVFNYSFGLMPYRCSVNTILGKPIRVDRDENPSNELVDHYHQLYMDSLHNLFEENKAQHGIADDIHLQFV